MANDIGLVLGSAIGPQYLTSALQAAEDSGFDEVWLAEDFFFTGGISAAAVSLAETSRIKIGLGVVSAMARHPALLAMELATLAGVFPGRLIAGIGLGVPEWVEQMGLTPASALKAVAECVQAVSALLRGETVDQEGEIFSFRDVKLTYPTGPGALPLHLGAIGPRMLELSGRIADGSVLSVLGGTGYLRWAKERVDAGRERAGRTDEHRLTSFALYSVDEDGARAKAAVRTLTAFHLAAGGTNALTDQAGISEELTALREGGRPLEETIPERWVDMLTVAGDPEEVVDKIVSFYEAGADAVGLFPVPVDDLERTVELTATRVLPALRAG